EVSVDDRHLQVVHELQRQRPIEPVPLLVLLYELRCRTLAEQGGSRIARQRVDPEEDQDRDAQQNRDEQQQPADDIPKHGSVVRRLRVYLLLTSVSSEL